MRSGFPIFDRSRRAFIGRVIESAGVALLAVHRPLQAQQPADENATSGIDYSGLTPFDDLMTMFVKEQQVPGAALAVTKDGRLAYARGFGLADRQRQQAVQPTALFRIASISKPITAVAVLQLVERKKLPSTPRYGICSRGGREHRGHQLPAARRGAVSVDRP
jgi:CubicO group peptidase (beta-lactamase class C family)